MPRGQPDYGMYAVKEVSASVSDMGEVAARLGSIVTYDKRGDVVFFDDFEEPILRWAADVPDALTYARLDSASAKSGSQALKLHTQNVLNEIASMSRLFNVLVSKRLGHEISFSLLSNDCELRSFVSVLGDPRTYEGEVMFDNFPPALYIETAPDVYTKIADIGSVERSIFMFQTLKLVVDFNTNKYVRLLFGNVEYDLSAYDLVSIGTALAPQVSTGAYIYNKAAAGGDVWLDDSIFTQAEP
ncbi:hypothetical protein ES707_16593 [subsurface metagenome]